VRRANKFETPGERDKIPPVAMVDDSPRLSSTYGKQKLPKSFEEMQRHGLKITSYTTTEDW
jgi:hypothetical protein